MLRPTLCKMVALIKNMAVVKKSTKTWFKKGRELYSFGVVCEREDNKMQVTRYIKMVVISHPGKMRWPDTTHVFFWSLIKDVIKCSLKQKCFTNPWGRVSRTHTCKNHHLCLMEGWVCPHPNPLGHISQKLWAWSRLTVAHVVNLLIVWQRCLDIIIVLYYIERERSYKIGR